MDKTTVNKQNLLFFFIGPLNWIKEFDKKKIEHLILIKGPRWIETIKEKNQIVVDSASVKLQRKSIMLKTFFFLCSGWYA